MSHSLLPSSPLSLNSLSAVLPSGISPPPPTPTLHTTRSSSLPNHLDPAWAFEHLSNNTTTLRIPAADQDIEPMSLDSPDPHHHLATPPERKLRKNALRRARNRDAGADLGDAKKSLSLYAAQIARNRRQLTRPGMLDGEGHARRQGQRLRKRHERGRKLSRRMRARESGAVGTGPENEGQPEKVIESFGSVPVQTEGESGNMVDFVNAFERMEVSKHDETMIEDFVDVDQVQ